MRLVPLLALGAILLVSWRAPAAAKEKKLPEKFNKSPYSLMSLSVGTPNSGWQLRAKKLKSSPHLRVKKGSGAFVYGHPALVLMLHRTSRDVGRMARGAKMLVGDLSAKSGGPLSGHRSHQSGRDADVGFYVRDPKGRAVTLDRFRQFGGDGKAKDGSGYMFDDHRNWLLVQSWIQDRRAGISHIFVAKPLRKRLLDYARKNKNYKLHLNAAAVLLKQPRSSSAHDDHFHVRIACPKRQAEICRG